MDRGTPRTYDRGRGTLLSPVTFKGLVTPVHIYPTTDVPAQFQLRHGTDEKDEKTGTDLGTSDEILLAK